MSMDKYCYQHEEERICHVFKDDGLYPHWEIDGMRQENNHMEEKWITEQRTKYDLKEYLNTAGFELTLTTNRL